MEANNPIVAFDVNAREFDLTDFKWHSDLFGHFFTATFYKKDDPYNPDYTGVISSLFEIDKGIRPSKQEQIAWLLERGFGDNGEPVGIDKFRESLMGTYTIDITYNENDSEFVKTPDEPSDEEMKHITEALTMFHAIAVKEASEQLEADEPANTSKSEVIKV